MISISAILIAVPGKEAALEKRLLALLPLVSREPGTIGYRIHRTQDKPGHFFFYEKYIDRAAIDLHMSTPHFKALLDDLQGLIVQPPEIIRHDEIGSIR